MATRSGEEEEGYIKVIKMVLYFGIDLGWGNMTYEQRVGFRTKAVL